MITFHHYTKRLCIIQRERPHALRTRGAVLLSEGRQYIKDCPWLTTFSGLAIMLAVLAFNLIGDALRDVLDPRLRGV